MSQLYPLLMTPLFDPRPWGTMDLAPIYPNHKFPEKIGEAWLTGDQCVVKDGPLAGSKLAELSQRFGRDLVGDTAPEDSRFPLLLKFLFPDEKLSVQVHPDDATAHQHGLPCGKTECWYVVQAKPGAQVGLGLKPGVTRDDLGQAIAGMRAEDSLNWINVYAGEMIYVGGGTVHTIGAGVVLVETQQQSDTTYRLYDYGRPRELHLKDGLAAVKVDSTAGKVMRPAPVAVDGGQNRFSRLVSAPHFEVGMYELKEPHTFLAGDGPGKSAAQILTAVEGCGVVEVAGKEPVTFAKGEAVVVAAVLGSFQVRPQWAVEFLISAVPQVGNPEPAVRP